MLHLYRNDCCLLSNRERSWLTQLKIYFWYSEGYRSKVDLAGMSISMLTGPPVAVWCYSQRNRTKKKQINALGLILLSSYSGFQLPAAMANVRPDSQVELLAVGWLDHTNLCTLSVRVPCSNSVKKIVYLCKFIFIRH